MQGYKHFSFRLAKTHYPLFDLVSVLFWEMVSEIFLG